jgi:tetratricopeptide (TPR) repeat protein
MVKMSILNTQQLGLSHEKRGSPHDAIFYFESFGCGTRPINALVHKGNVLRKLGRYDQALTCYDKILEKLLDSASVRYHKACTKSLQNDIERL